MNVAEWLAGLGDYQSEPIFQGSRAYGELRTYADGSTVYVAWRERSESYNATNGWAIDWKTLNDRRIKGATHLVVEIIESLPLPKPGQKKRSISRQRRKRTGELFSVPMSMYQDTSDQRRWTTINFLSKGGSVQKLLPIEEFETYRPVTVFSPITASHR
jgi:hypothetical protein